MPLLEIKNLSVCYEGPNGQMIPAVNGLSLSVRAGKIVGLLGESGCGKTATAKSIVRLQQPAKILGGEIIYHGRQILELSNGEIGKLRGGEIALVFQDPSTALNPVFTVGRLIADVVVAHQNGLTKAQIDREVAGLLAKVELSCAVQKAYPHQLSGGMKQRVMLAMALAGKPRLIIADEATSGLDASIARRVLDLFQKIRQKDELTMLFITHDVGAAAYLCDEIALMYKGRLVERADKTSFFQECRHPYSRDLLACMPQRYCNKEKISGAVPEDVTTYEDTDTACPYYRRCRLRKPVCKQQLPVWRQISSTHWVCCWDKG